MKIEFVDFKITPEEIKQIGVATVCIDEKIRLRYKVVRGRDVKGYFLQPASHKIGEDFIPAFMLGNHFDAEDIELAIRSALKELFENEANDISF